jgi:hypothetical protein
MHVESLLTDEDYTPPTEIPFVEPREQADYLNGHRAGWLAFADGMRTFTADSPRRTSLPVLAVLRPKEGSRAALAGFDAGFREANALNLERQAPSRQPEAEWESPVGQPDKLDLIARKKDGTVAVMLVAAGKLDPSDERTAAVLEAKLRNYCRYIKHPAFAAEFGQPTEDRVKLVLRSDLEVPERYIHLLAQVAEEEDVPAGLEVRYE